MTVKDLTPTGRHASLTFDLRDPVLMAGGILCWLRSRVVSGVVCICVGTCLLLRYCSVCQVRKGSKNNY